MTSIADICNRALSDIAAQATINDLTMDVTNEAIQCNLWYDKLRRQLLRTAPWGFCRRQVVLTQVGDLVPDNTAPYPWLYMYAYPSDCLKLRYLLYLPPQLNPPNPPAVGTPVGPPWILRPSRNHKFIVVNTPSADGSSSSKNLVTNVGPINNGGSAIGVYNGDVTDPDMWDDLFEGALTAALSYHLTMPLTGNIGMRAEFKKTAEDAITAARVADGNEAIPTSDVTVDWMQTRGVGSYWGYGPQYGLGDGLAGWGSWTEGYGSMGWGA